MRLDKFAEKHRISMAVVDQFGGYSVEVALPPDWEAFASPPGTRALVWRADPFMKQFCANVVLTMTQIDAMLDPYEAFAMLCEWQKELLPGVQETSRDLAEVHGGQGLAGMFAMRVATAGGLLDSFSLARVITAETRTLIAQLTLTKLPDSPVDCAHIGLAVRQVEMDAPSVTFHPAASSADRMWDH